MISKLCYEFSAVCIFSKKYPPSYFFEKCHTAHDLKLFSKLYYEFSAVCVFAKSSRLVGFSLDDLYVIIQDFLGDHNITMSLLQCDLSVVTFLGRVITFLCSLLDDHFVTFLAVCYYISMQLLYYISMQVLLHFYAGITFLCKVVTFLCRLLHF